MASKVKGTSSTKKKQVEPRLSSFDLSLTGKNVLETKSANKKERKQKSTVNSTVKTGTSTDKEKQGKVEYDRDEEDRFIKMLAGCTKKLPQFPHSVVRIFLSSTFSDMRAERNTLAREVYPKLKELCSLYDLDFQVVDMRWGVTEDSQNDHSVENICLMEIENCQRVSLGPNFVLISGDRYGFRPVPTEIGMEEFEALVYCAKENQVENFKLLETWYLLDENAKPPMYVLQPVRSQFPFFGDYSPGCDEPRQKDTENWRKTFALLQDTLRKAANAAFKAKKIKPLQLHQYFLSVTECEINKGILQAQNPAAHVLVYHRQLVGLGADVLNHDSTARRYIDAIEQDGKFQIDEEAKNLRVDLIFSQLSNIFKTNKKSCSAFTVQWKPGGINPAVHTDHSDYLQNFCMSFISDVTNLVDKALHEKDVRIRVSEYYTDYEELLHHLHFCNLKCKTFCGQEETLQKAKDYVLNDGKRSPFVIHAPSGAGKTSVTAMIMESLSSWYKNKEHVALIRFLGTSPLSLNIYDVLRSVCGQLADNAELIMEPVAYRNMKNLTDYFPRFLRRAANKLKCPVVILLDSLDQLSKENNAYICSWLPTTLPANVKVILSTLPEEHGILSNLKQILPAEECYCEIPVLSDQTGREIIDKYLGMKRRILTRPQEKLILRTFTKSPGPLFLKLLLDEALKWNSYTPDHQLNLASSIQGAVNQLFETLESKFGQVITSHALGYITIGYNGISEIEIEDALSCDDEALNDVYRYHNPPVEGIVRIPPVLWARIRFDLQEYLVERISYGKHTLNWYHRQFIETARHRYAMGHQAEKLHAVMAEIYMAEQNVLRDVTLLRRKVTIPNADRQVTPQPMVPKNRRKLGCLPYHLIHAAHQINESVAKERCFCSFDFLKAKLSAFPVSIVEEDFNMYLERREDEELQLLRHFFSVCKSDISQPMKLALNLLSFIDPDSDHVSLKNLQTQAMKYLCSMKKPSLIPIYPGLAPKRDTSSALIASMEQCENILSQSPEMILIRTSGKKIDEESKDVHGIFNTVSGELIPVSIPDCDNTNLVPKLDHEGKQILYTLAGQVETFNVTSMTKISKKFENISPELKQNSKPVLTTFSSDTCHFLILFEDADLLVLETSGMVKVFYTILKEEAENITDIICTNAEDMKLVVLGKKDSVDHGPNTGFARMFYPNHESKGNKEKYVQFGSPFIKGLSALCSTEELIVAAVESQERENRLICIDLESLKEQTEIEVKCKISQLSAAKSKSMAAILTAKGSVCIIDCSDGKIDHELITNNPVTCFGVSWLHNLVFLGDNQGQITLYTAKKGQNNGSFPAHSKAVKQVCVLDDHIITFGENKEIIQWSISAIWKDITQSKLETMSNEKGSSLLTQKNVCSFDVNTEQFVTASKDKAVRVFTFENVGLQEEHDIEIQADKIQLAVDNICVALEQSTGEMKVFDVTSGSDILSDLPTKCFDFTMSKDLVTVYVLSKDKNDVLYINLIDLKLRTMKKSFPLKTGLKYENIDISVNANERFLILRCKCTADDRKEIEASWKKQASFMPQDHPYRFTAVDLLQASGGLMHCFRMLSKIPVLGEVIAPYSGNVMMISTRRWIVHWDIPTGKCDQRVTKTKTGMMYRPEYVGADCKGTSLAVVPSNDGNLVGVGSEDGYFIIYGAESGIPVGKTAPNTKHSASVICAIGSPDNKWFVSACKNRVIKLWDAKTATEVFSLRVDAEVRQMKFSKNSTYLLVLTGSHITRMLIYKVHSGTQESN